MLLEFYIPFLRIREVLQTPVNYNYNYHHSNGQGSYLIEATRYASYRADQGPGHLRQLLKFVN